MTPPKKKKREYWAVGRDGDIHSNDDEGRGANVLVYQNKGDAIETVEELNSGKWPCNVKMFPVTITPIKPKRK